MLYVMGVARSFSHPSWCFFHTARPDVIRCFAVHVCLAAWGKKLYNFNIWKF